MQNYLACSKDSSQYQSSIFEKFHGKNRLGYCVVFRQGWLHFQLLLYISSRIIYQLSNMNNRNVNLYLLIFCANREHVLILIQLAFGALLLYI